MSATRSPEIAPPRGQSRTVASFQPSRATLYGALGVYVAVGVAILVSRGAFMSGQRLQGLLVVLGLSLPIVLLAGRVQLAAGAGWVSVRNGIARRKWVRSDDVVHVRQTTTFIGVMVRLQDRDGRKVSLTSGDVVQNARLAGQLKADLRTSIDRGLVVPPETMKAFGLDNGKGKR